MDNFAIIYKILKELEKAMDFDEFDMDVVSAERLGITQNRWYRIWEMLSNERYVDGISIKYGVQGDVMVSVSVPRITIKGLEYLHENSLMKKASDVAKGIVKTVPMFMK